MFCFPLSSCLSNKYLPSVTDISTEKQISSSLPKTMLKYSPSQLKLCNKTNEQFVSYQQFGDLVPFSIEDSTVIATLT